MNMTGKVICPMNTFHLAIILKKEKSHRPMTKQQVMITLILSVIYIGYHTG
jgi:hypothetical protein